MAQRINQLSPRTISTKNKRGRYADGGGLYLQVSDNGAKSWLFRFTLNGQSRQMGLGSVNTFTLPEAREAALKCRKLLHEGIDPIEDRKRKRGQRQVDAATLMTFEDCAERYISAHSPAWKNFKHSSQWQNTLKTYVYPVFGNLPVQSVDTGLVMKVLEPIWTVKTETASRVRGRIESVLDYASSLKYRSGENPARWKGHLDNLLAKRAKVQKVKHHPALPYDDMGSFMEQLRKHEAVSARGLEFKILTATRTIEVTGAKWDEFDIKEAVWLIPAERMKGGKEHRVPLSSYALAILRNMKEIAVSDYVFPGGKKNRPLSNMAFNQLLKRMGISNKVAVPHGFRSTFLDWAGERTGFQNEVSNMALAHTISSKVEAAYRRGDLFDKRRRLMEAWAVYCFASPEANTDNIVQINRVE